MQRLSLASKLAPSVIALLALLGQLGACAHIGSGAYGTAVDAAGRPSAAEAKAAKLQISAGEKNALSSPYFGEIELTFENPTAAWITVEQVTLDFGSDYANRTVTFPWGARLESWATATAHRNAVREANQAVALELLALGGAVAAGAAAGRHAPAVHAAGGFASLAAVTALTANQMVARAEDAESAPIFEGNHLFNVPFDVPPGLFIKRWLVVNTPADPRVGCLTGVFMTYVLSDKTSHRIALAFRSASYTHSEWQANVCLPRMEGNARF